MITLLSHSIENDSGIELPIQVNVHYRLIEFIELLQQCSPKTNAKISFLIIENDEIKYKDIFKIGFHNPVNLMSMVRNNAIKLDADDGVMATIKRLEEEWETNNQNTTIVAFSNDTPVNKTTENEPSKKMKPPKFIFGTLMVLTLGAIAFGGVHIANNLMGYPKMEQTGTGALEKLLKDKAYHQAIKQFPDKQEDIAWHIYKTKDVESLETWNQTYETPNSKFDLYFLKENYSNLLGIEGITFNSERQFMLGVTYIELDRLNDAIWLNYVLKSDELAKMIRPKVEKNIKASVSKKEFDAAKNYNKWVNGELDDYIEKAERIQALLSDYTKRINEEKDDTKKAELNNIVKLWQTEWQELTK